VTDARPAPTFPTSAPLFDKRAFGRYRIPRLLGEAVSGLDDPGIVAAASADHMRTDDYVIGLVFRGRARAYPLWIVDNYHVVNDRVDGERIVVASCERCQSGSAFVPDVPGDPEREPLFRSVGFLNATLVLKDLRSASHWLHYDGLGLDRRAAGRRLPWIPTYHMEWGEWLDLHPDSEVMVPPDDVTHPDARHGHGREEIFARPGMDPAFLSTIVGELDRTYPENEMVLAIEGGDGWLAFPLQEVRREGGVVPLAVGGRTGVVVAGPRTSGFAMAAYATSVSGRALTFRRDGDGFVDHETGSTWSIEGVARAGELEGTRLEPIPWSYVRWHAWVYWHRNTQLFISERDRPALGGGVSMGSERLDRIAEAWVSAGLAVLVGEPLVSQRWPNQAGLSETVYVDGHRIRMHELPTVSSARDLHAFDAAWSGWPISARSHEGRTRRIGNVVIESDPEERYVDPANVVPLPDGQVDWAPALDAPVLDTALPDEPVATVEPGFVDVIRAFRLSGYEILDIGFLPRGQLRAGMENAIALTIEAERFLLYRFEDEAAAERYAAAESRAVGAGRYVLRSTPDTMYTHQPTEVLYVGDDAVRWSMLPNELAFVRAFRSGAGADP
jgi:hypothetical protein